MRRRKFAPHASRTRDARHPLTREAGTAVGAEAQALLCCGETMMSGFSTEPTMEMQAATAHARILVVDDEPSARRGLELLLRDAGFTVACASDGAAALEEAERFLPDVVITDVRMPVLDGLTLCARLHERDPELPVIV